MSREFGPQVWLRDFLGKHVLPTDPLQTRCKISNPGCQQCGSEFQAFCKSMSRMQNDNSLERESSCDGPDLSSELRVATDFFHRLNQSALPYCLLSGYDPSANSVASDLDFMVPSRDVTLCGLMIRDFCRERNLRLVQVLEHEVGGLYYVINWCNAAREMYLALDVCGDYRRRGRIWLRADGILARRQIDDAGIYKAFAPDALLYYLIKRSDKNDLGPDQIQRLRNLLLTSGNDGLDRLTPYLGKPLARSVCSRLTDGTDEQIVGLLPLLRAKLLRSQPPDVTRIASLVAWAADGVRRYRRWIKPTGITIAVLGPDGSGKSSAIKEMLKVVEPAFRQTKTMHLRPRLFGSSRSSAEAITQPHGKKNRGALLSIIKILYFAMDYLIGWTFLVVPLTRSSTIIVFDRYFHDLFIDPARFRYGGPMWLIRIVANLIPKPNLVFVLDAPTATLQSRKTEVPSAETERQRSLYASLAHRGFAFLIDASEPLPSVSQQIAEQLLNYLNQRTIARVGNKVIRIKDEVANFGNPD